MATAILTNELGLTKYFSATIEVPRRKREFSMMKRSPIIIDAVSAKERLKTPFSYKWLKFKTGFFGLVLMRGAAHEQRTK